jgi:hypothetical protein
MTLCSWNLAIRKHPGQKATWTSSGRFRTVVPQTTKKSGFGIVHSRRQVEVDNFSGIGMSKASRRDARSKVLAFAAAARHRDCPREAALV